MKVFIFPGNAPNVNFALAADGTVLKVFGDEEIQNVGEHYSKEYLVEVVEDPKHHEEVQAALACGKIRSKIKKGDIGWARVELFRWQYGDLPKKGDARALNIKEAVLKMIPAVISCEATRENTVMVLAYLATLLPELEDKPI